MHYVSVSESQRSYVVADEWHLALNAPVSFWKCMYKSVRGPLLLAMSSVSLRLLNLTYLSAQLFLCLYAKAHVLICTDA